MNIKPIGTSRDYDAALKTIESLMSARAGTAEGDHLDVLVTLIQAYEGKHFPMMPPDPVEAIKFIVERLDVQLLAEPGGSADLGGGAMNYAN